jgi:uroporphyrinogen-III synthase
MSSARPSLLLTRPKAQSLRFADAFAARFGADWPIVISPLTELVFLSPDLPQDQGRALIFTSETAVAAFARLTDRRDMTVFCVGPRTARVAAGAGFTDVRAGDSDGLALTAAIIASGHAGPFLHVRGAHVARDLAGTLAAAGMQVEQVIAYDQPPLPMTPQAMGLMRSPGRVLLPLFSPRAAELAGLSMVQAGGGPLIAAISEAVARAAAGLRPSSLVIARRPDASAMLDALDDLIDASAA